MQVGTGEVVNASYAKNVQDILSFVVEEANGKSAGTIRDYLYRLLSTLWQEQECFSGKRLSGEQ